MKGLLSSDHERALIVTASATVLRIIEAFRDLVSLVNGLDLSQAAAAGMPTSLDSNSLLAHNRLDCISRCVPSLVRRIAVRDQSILDAKELRSMPHSVLLTGPPGSGKTTFCRWSCWEDISTFDQQHAGTIPVFIPLHTLNSIPTDFVDAFFGDEPLRELVTPLLNRTGASRIRLYLDGLDEMPNDLQPKVLAAARCAAAANVQVLVTARDHVATPASGWLTRIRLLEADDGQLLRLASEYYRDDAALVEDFTEQLDRSPKFKDVMRTPLLAILAIAYFRTSRSIPRSKVDLYELFTKLLCGGWDLVKSVRRSCRFGEQLKRDVLTSFAYHLQKNNTREGSTSDFEEAVKHNAFRSDGESSISLLEEVVADGMIVRAGRLFSFPHLSFQEYFASRALASPDMAAANAVLSLYLAGDDWWRDVLAFYVLSLNRPPRLDWWLYERKRSSLMLATLKERVEFLYAAAEERFPDKLFSRPY